MNSTIELHRRSHIFFLKNLWRYFQRGVAQHVMAVGYLERSLSPRIHWLTHAPGFPWLRREKTTDNFSLPYTEWKFCPQHLEHFLCLMGEIYIFLTKCEIESLNKKTITRLFFTFVFSVMSLISAHRSGIKSYGRKHKLWRWGGGAVGRNTCRARAEARLRVRRTHTDASLCGDGREEVRAIARSSWVRQPETCSRKQWRDCLKTRWKARTETRGCPLTSRVRSGMWVPTLTHMNACALMHGALPR